MEPQAQHNKNSAAFIFSSMRQGVSFKISVDRQILPFYALPTYLGIKVDRALTLCQHLESLRKKLTRIELLMQLAGSSRGASATVQRTITLALVHSTAEYCAPVWFYRAHTRFIDKPTNDALHIVTGCLRPTPMDKTFVLAGIQPPELRR